MTGTAASLIERIRDRRVVVGLIDLGDVGLPLAQLFEEAGFPVVGCTSGCAF